MPPPTSDTTWFVTVAAAPSSDETGGSSLQISADKGNTWSSSLILTFDGSQFGSGSDPTRWDRDQQILVRAVSGSVEAGDATIEIMHSVYGTTGTTSSIIGFTNVAVSNVDV